MCEEDETALIYRVSTENAILINVLIIYQIMALKRHFLFGHLEKINGQGGSKNKIFG
ncbi:hypothetical protein HMPREF1254_0280 [Prevotella sp. BV3P1]|nr:hypothetical protein HMPREF1254_0280 [Prevotella sp. BV3P1]